LFSTTQVANLNHQSDIPSVAVTGGSPKFPQGCAGVGLQVPHVAQGQTESGGPRMTGGGLRVGAVTTNRRAQTVSSRRKPPARGRVDDCVRRESRWRSARRWRAAARFSAGVTGQVRAARVGWRGVPHAGSIDFDAVALVPLGDDSLGALELLVLLAGVDRTREARAAACRWRTRTGDGVRGSEEPGRWPLRRPCSASNVTAITTSPTARSQECPGGQVPRFELLGQGLGIDRAQPLGIGAVR
jgi:hypothetical protein